MARRSIVPRNPCDIIAFTNKYTSRPSTEGTMTNLVLIADHDRASRDSYKLFLESCGYQVEIAGDGLSCIQQLVHHRPDLLVLDQELLWGGAEGVLEFLREEQNGTTVPVVLVASEQSTADPASLVSTPVVACLRKPVQKSAVLLCTLLDHLSPLNIDVPETAAQ